MKAPFPIREVQTDNGTEFTNRLIVAKSKHLTLFEDALQECCRRNPLYPLHT